MSEYVGRSVDDVNAEHPMELVVNIAGETIANAGFAKRVREAVETRDVPRIYRLGPSSPVIVFIRSDGWMLGTPAQFERVAYNMWKEAWVGFCRVPNDIILDISEYEEDFV